jgi:hypothetical protein
VQFCVEDREDMYALINAGKTNPVRLRAMCGRKDTHLLRTNRQIGEKLKRDFQRSSGRRVIINQQNARIPARRSS